MKMFFRRVSAFLQVSLGLDQMSVDFKKFATMHSMYQVFQGMVGVYIVSLLMRVSGSGDIVKWYNIINFFVTGIMMPVAVVFMRKKNTNLVTRIGIMGFIVLYTTLLFTMNSADKMMPVFGVLSGFANAFYWITYASYVSAFTVDSKRDVAVAFLGFVNGIITLIMPTLSGLVIEWIPGFWGYMVVFGLAFVVAVITILLSLRLPKHVNPEGEKNTNLYFGRALKNIVKHAYWRSGMMAECVRGIREGTFNFLLNLLLFEVVKSEALLGFNTLLTGIGTIISFWVIGKIIKPHNRVKAMFTATTILLAGSLLPALSLSPVVLIVFAFVNAFFSQFIVNPSNNIFFYLIQQKAEPNSREEYFSIKEFLLGMGRVIGIAILFIFPPSQMGYVIAIIVLTLTQFVTAGLGKHTLTLLKRDEEKELAEHAKTVEA